MEILIITFVSLGVYFFLETKTEFNSVTAIFLALYLPPFFYFFMNVETIILTFIIWAFYYFLAVKIKINSIIVLFISLFLPIIYFYVKTLLRL